MVSKDQSQTEAYVAFSQYKLQNEYIVLML
jgi:hypothetical protein